ncbi:uncharacterized protein LOC134257333 [Saccostrea cucullata]|uniref:uncharacterized protein LOC134257333 n=1 Tax=Saccostrea cuccullata TaxID=36930 RepID=UPI002ED489EA
MPEQGRKRMLSQAAEGSDQCRTRGNFKKTKTSNNPSNENPPTTSHEIKENESMEETFSSPQNFETTSDHHKNTKEPCAKSKMEKELQNTQNHLEEIEDLTNENLEISFSSSLHETLDEDEMSEEASNKVNASVSGSAMRSYDLISDKGANFLKLCYFICRLVTKAARTWFKSKYPERKLKKKQKKLRKAMGNDNNKTFLKQSDEEIMVIYDALDISSIVYLSRKLGTNSEWKNCK